jgi:hypothetical protein
VPVAVQTVDAVTGRALGILVHGAVLARPDGMPCASWSEPVDAVHALAGAITAEFGDGIAQAA